ncbi:MAG: M1 family aminopeptidase, partial [Bacteroidia bacterium]|nr:M1 family aminopeptidase [Bacteroidia bacterium]
PQYIAEAIEKLSQWVGPYPYDHATAVESSLEAGGGMEYPMITVIIPTRDTSTLRQIVVHEVGHNWFQGLLGSNERLHPWQDEGINSYYEKRILSDDPLFQSYGSAVRGVGYETLISVPLESAFYHHLNADVAPGASSYRHSILSYALGVYQQTSVILRSAAAAYTPQHWDTAMQHYFRKWAFRHPYPEDWATSLSEKGLSGEGLLRYLETDREVDIRLHSQRMSDKTYRLQLEEPTRRLPRPFWVEAVAISRDGQIQESYRLPLDSVVQLSLPGETYTFLVNPQLYLYERRTGNNFLYTRSLFPTWRKVRIAFGYPKPFYRAHVTHVGLFPAFGYNYRDGLLLGLGAYHGLFPKHTGEFHLLPMYSFLRQDLRGSAGFTLRAFPGDSRIQLVELHLRSASFAGFWRTKASLEATLRRRYDRLGGRQILRLRSHHLAFQNLESRAYTWINSGRPAYLAVDWEGRREDPILNLYGMVSIGHDLQGHTRAEAEGQLSWQLLRKWTPWMRGYVGWVQKGAPDYLLLRPSGYDAFGEAVLLDRFREGPRLLRQQIPENQGGWRTPTDTLRSSILIGGNAELPLPKLSFVRLRLDGGYLPEEKRSYWGLSLGLPVVRIRGRFLTGGYFPLLGSSFPGGKPSSTKEIIQSLTWSVQIPLDSRWLVPW